MKSFLRIFALILALCSLYGCVGAAPGPSSTTPTTQPAVSTPEEETLYQQLFDSEHQIQLNLRMSDEELAKLQQDYEKYSSRGSKSPIYRMADLDVTITDPEGNVATYTIEQVGVRMKGNTSRTSFYNEKDGIYNLIHFKISFQETFDKEEYYGNDALVWSDDESREARKNRTFATLEKMDLRWNKCNDSTYIREHYAFEMFRENGVLAPRTGLASMDWAGLHMGVFTIYEPVDKVFLNRNLPKQQQGGDLYKCGWTSHGADFTAVDSIGVEDEYKGQFYAYDLKTNKKKSDHSSLIQFITDLNSGNVTKESFAELVDIDNFLSFAAVTYLLGNPDDARNNYNNFYIYFPPEGGCMLIPTDYDRCLGITHEWDPTGNAVTTDDPFGMTMATGNHQQSPLYLYSICQGGYYMEEYARKLQEIAQSQWLTPAYFESIFTQAKALYGDLTTPDKQFHNAADHKTTMTVDGSDGNMTFRHYTQAKLDTLNKALAKMDLSGKPQIPSSIYIRADCTNWDILPGYAMEENEDGLYQFIIPGGRVKVFDKIRNQWYGSENLDENTTISWETDKNTNIILADGQYLLTFDPDTLIITITPV